MVRLDKFCAELGMGTRSEVKQVIRGGKVLLNGQVCHKPETKINEETDQVVYQGRECKYEKFVYYMLNKPVGVVSATQDDREKTVIDVLREQVELTQEVFPVGRLDKDTEGLLLLTNDGALSHRLLSPRHHVPKTYEVHCKQAVTEDMLKQLTDAVDIGESTKTLPATAELLTEDTLLLTITEGKFHQVKRMLQAVGNEVIYLKRLQMASLRLDERLKPGQARCLKNDEISGLQEY